jgi:hypothetical protein
VKNFKAHHDAFNVWWKKHGHNVAKVNGRYWYGTSLITPLIIARSIRQESGDARLEDKKLIEILRERVR